MAQTLPAPSTALAGIPGGGTVAGLLLPAAESTTVTGTQVNFANNGAILVRVVMSTVAATIQFLVQRQILGANLATGFANAFSEALTASDTYIFGPFSPSVFNDVHGLAWIQFSAIPTGATIGSYQLAGTQQ